MSKKLLTSKYFPVIFLIMTVLAVFSVYGILQMRRALVADKNFMNDLLQRSVHAPLCPDCNVILVSLDTLSANHLPCYGYNRNTAPALCEFGKENIMFDNMYANAHFTLPSHVSIFTGLLPSTHGVNVANHDKLSLFTNFLPSLLQSQGYDTNFVMITHDPHLPIDLVYNRGIDAIIGDDTGGMNHWTDGLLKLADNEKKGKKTFLFLHTYYVHSPYLIGNLKPIYTDVKNDPIVPNENGSFYSCSDDFISYLKNSIEKDLKEGYWYARQKEYADLYNLLMTTQNPSEACKDNADLVNNYRYNYFYNPAKINTPEKVDYIRALYDQKINQLDGKLKILFDFISQENIKKNTIVIITADHGEEFMEHGELQHSTLYDSNLRIPLMMYVPGVSKKEIEGIAQSIDLAPTILDLVGVSYHDGSFQGNSLLEAIKIGKNNEQYAVAERIFDNSAVIRNNQYKLFVKKQGGAYVPYQLFDISKDPRENDDILFSHPDTVNNLRNRLQTILKK